MSCNPSLQRVINECMEHQEESNCPGEEYWICVKKKIAYHPKLEELIKYYKASFDDPINFFKFEC